MPTVMKNGIPTHISVEEYNETLAKHRKDVLGIDENTGKLPHFKVEDLDKFWINGQEFRGLAYQGLMTVNTKTYVEEPTRKNDGSIPDINDYDTFVVPRFTANLKYFNIYDYQRLCEAVQSNEFYVEYYDKQFVDENTGTLAKVKHLMYIEPMEMEKLYNVGTDVFGVLDFEVSFIGTLNDLQEFTVTYVANGGSIVGNPIEYAVSTTYKKGDKVFLGERYFEAIWFKNTFKPSTENVALTNTTYWKPYNYVFEYSASTTYNKGSIAYEIIKDSEGKETGRKYYIGIYNGTFNGRPFTDSDYWKLIIIKKYSAYTTYSSNKTSRDDTNANGQFVLEQDANGTKVYEAIYFVDEFSGKDPTNTTYWTKLAIGSGIRVKWGNSIVVEYPENLFNAPNKKHADYWTTNPDGTGFSYVEGQSINVFRDLTLYAKWE